MNNTDNKTEEMTTRILTDRRASLRKRLRVKPSSGDDIEDGEVKKTSSRTRMRRPAHFRATKKQINNSKISPVMMSIKRMRIRHRDKSDEATSTSKSAQETSTLHRFGVRGKPSPPFSSMPSVLSSLLESSSHSAVDNLDIVDNLDNLDSTTEHITVSPQAHVIKYTVNDANEEPTEKLVEDTIINDQSEESEEESSEKLLSTFHMPQDVFR